MYTHPEPFSQYIPAGPATVHEGSPSQRTADPTPDHGPGEASNAGSPSEISSDDDSDSDSDAAQDFDLFWSCKNGGGGRDDYDGDGSSGGSTALTTCNSVEGGDVVGEADSKEGAASGKDSQDNASDPLVFQQRLRDGLHRLSEKSGAEYQVNTPLAQPRRLRRSLTCNRASPKPGTTSQLRLSK